MDNMNGFVLRRLISFQLTFTSVISLGPIFFGYILLISIKFFFFLFQSSLNYEIIGIVMSFLWFRKEFYNFPIFLLLMLNSELYGSFECEAKSINVTDNNHFKQTLFSQCSERKMKWNGLFSFFLFSCTIPCIQLLAGTLSIYWNIITVLMAFSSKIHTKRTGEQFSR